MDEPTAVPESISTSAPNNTNSTRSEISSCVLLNAQSINPSASSVARWKVHDLRAYIHDELKQNHHIPFLALTETWLKSYISDAQLHIPEYVVSRSDRDKRTGGGVLLYSHESLPISNCSKFDDGTCQALFCTFAVTSMCASVVYRPPNATLQSFRNCITFIQDQVNLLDDNSYKVCVMGDFNFPNIDWELGSAQPGKSSDETHSADLLLKFMSDNFLNQYVLMPTRESNILDLFLTNDGNLVTNVKSTKTDLSDHNLIEIMLASNPAHDKDNSKQKRARFTEDSFRSLDFQKANFEEIGEKISAIDWEQLRSKCNFEDFPALFTEAVLNICKSSVPQKKSKSGKPKMLNALRRKKKRLQARLNCILQRN